MSDSQHLTAVHDFDDVTSVDQVPSPSNPEQETDSAHAIGSLIQLRSKGDSVPFVGEADLNTSMVAKEHSCIISLQKILEAKDRIFGPYEVFIRSHVSSTYRLPFSISPMCSGESVLDGPPESFTFYFFPSVSGVCPLSPSLRWIF